MRNKIRSLLCSTEGVVLMVFVLFFYLGNGAAAGIEWQAARGDLLRLHILGASDLAEDQRVKLAVRDAILEQYGSVFLTPATEAQAEALANQLLPSITRTALEVLEKQGDSRGVQTSLTTAFFPSRRYGNVVLPAGNYRAVRVILGEGAGANWWCVLYPPLCVAAAGSPNQILDVTAPQLPLEPRLAVVDGLEHLLHTWEQRQHKSSQQAQDFHSPNTM